MPGLRLSECKQNVTLLPSAMASRIAINHRFCPLVGQVLANGVRQGRGIGRHQRRLRSELAATN